MVYAEQALLLWIFHSIRHILVGFFNPKAFSRNIYG